MLAIGRDASAQPGEAMSDLSGYLTTTARDVLAINVGNAYAALVPASPHLAARRALDRLAQEGSVAGARDWELDSAAQAGLWLWHDYLDESHTISQGIETPEGSFWHAIMHRREGDFWNSKYWLRRVGRHAAFAAIAAEARKVIERAGNPAPPKGIATEAWDPFAFVDLCESVHDRPHDPQFALAVELQRIEWRALFEHCALGAVARA